MKKQLCFWFVYFLSQYFRIKLLKMGKVYIISKGIMIWVIAYVLMVKWIIRICKKISCFFYFNVWNNHRKGYQYYDYGQLFLCLQKSLHVGLENEYNLTFCVNTRLNFIQLVANTCFLCAHENEREGTAYKETNYVIHYYNYYNFWHWDEMCQNGE